MSILVGNAIFNPAPDLVAGMSEQELRVLAKTTAQLNIEHKRGSRFADSYFRNLTPIQVAVLRKFSDITSGKMTDRERQAFINLGLL